MGTPLIFLPLILQPVAPSHISQIFFRLAVQDQVCIRQRVVIDQVIQFGLLLQDGRKISIGCTGVEDALNVTMAQQTELDYLIYNDPLAYADLILNGEPEEYLRNMTGSHGLED